MAVSLACLALVRLATAGATPQLSVDTPLATGGYYVLSWTADTPRVALAVRTPGTAVESIVYTGPDRATTVSGQVNGTRIYRVGELDTDGRPSAWSEPVTVTVAHHPLRRALAFFAVGALVFFATLLLIVQGARSRP
jgi:hypothetical protein